MGCVPAWGKAVASCSTTALPSLGQRSGGQQGAGAPWEGRVLRPGCRVEQAQGDAALERGGLTWRAAGQAAWEEPVAAPGLASRAPAAPAPGSLSPWALRGVRCPAPGLIAVSHQRPDLRTGPRTPPPCLLTPSSCPPRGSFRGAGFSGASLRRPADGPPWPAGVRPRPLRTSSVSPASDPGRLLVQVACRVSLAA